MNNNLKSLVITSLIAFMLAIPSLSAAAEDNALNKVKTNNSEDIDSAPTNLTYITPSQLEAKFEDAWFKGHKKGVDIAATVDIMIEIMLDNGIANLPDYSSALIVEAKEAHKEGESDKAIALYQQAIKLSPRMSIFRFELAEMHFRALNVVDGINTYLEAVKIRARNFIESKEHTANINLYLTVIIVFFITTFLLLVSLKYINLFYHDITHIFPLNVKSILIKLYTIVLFLLPLCVNLGIFWQGVYLILLCYIYGIAAEKKICYLIVVLLALLPFLVTDTLKIFAFTNSNEVKEIYRANEGTWYFDTEEKLERRLSKHPDDIDLLLSLGLVSKRRRDYAKAEKYYLKGLRLSPDSYELNLNLGNVYLARNDSDTALEYYNKAEAADPTRGTVHYNLNTLYLKLVMIEDAEGEMQKARKLSPDIVDYYSEVMNTSSPNFNRLVIDELVSKESYSKRFKKYKAGAKNISSKILPYHIKALPFEDIPFVSLALLLILALMSFINKSYAFTSTCQKCGGAVCYKCQRSIKDNKLCSQCYFIIVKREGVDPKSRIVKMLQIKNYVARRIVLSKLLSFILPGTGHLLKGLTLRGTIFLIISIILGVNLVLPRGFIHELYITGANGPCFTFGSYIILVLFIINYIVSLADVFRSD